MVKVHWILLFNLFTLVSAMESAEYVILLHGLCRTESSMVRMEESLTSVGYNVVNVAYPSRSKSIRELSDESISNAVDSCREQGAKKSENFALVHNPAASSGASANQPLRASGSLYRAKRHIHSEVSTWQATGNEPNFAIHFVTHSMGGIMVRDYLSRHEIPNLGRVVMLAPPNKGSEVVDKLGKLSLFKWINGPAGQELSTREDSLPNRIGAFKYPLGVIAGDRSINWINSLMIPGRDDGKVSIDRTRLEGMTDHIIVHATHPFIMKNRKAIHHTIAFLKSGKF